MTTDDIVRWLAHPRRHWCLVCKTPVQRLRYVERKLRGHELGVTCHGVDAVRFFFDAFVEDGGRRTVRWFDAADRDGHRGEVTA